MIEMESNSYSQMIIKLHGDQDGYTIVVWNITRYDKMKQHYFEWISDIVYRVKTIFALISTSYILLGK